MANKAIIYHRPSPPSHRVGEYHVPLLVMKADRITVPQAGTRKCFRKAAGRRSRATPPGALLTITCGVIETPVSSTNQWTYSV